MTIRFRPRFSLRTFAVLVTLVCAYFGAWEATKNVALAENRRIQSDVLPTASGAIAIRSYSPMPFIVSRDEGYPSGWVTPGPKRYYLWLFGATVKLPIESEWE